MVHRLVVATYLCMLGLLCLYGIHRLWILYLYKRHHKKAPPIVEPPPPREWPLVTVQLPIYNEYYVVERLIDAVCAFDYPKDRLEVQVLDDSTDQTREITEKKVREKAAQGFRIQRVARAERAGFKAGALAEGLKTAGGGFVAIFDADFLPPTDFLKRTIPHFADEKIGMVQARWGHVNAGYSLMTRLQSIFLDGHFLLEHTARSRSGAFFNFNGTAGVWRRRAIEDAGGWSASTLTEDLDLSYRAQLGGWRFLFLPDVLCPAELPVDIAAFRSQQYRWTKGALQVAKKVLPTLWRSRFPLPVKIEGTAHLTSNLGYFLLMGLSLLFLPNLLARQSVALPPLIKALELAALAAAAISIVIFYVVARREAAPQARGLGLRDMPALMAFGLGMCLNNSRAVWEALSGKSTDFKRTPKFNILRSGDPWKDKIYSSSPRGAGWPEAAAGAYLFATLLWGLLAGQWAALPFIALFFLGYCYVAWMSLVSRG